MKVFKIQFLFHNELFFFKTFFCNKSIDIPILCFINHLYRIISIKYSFMNNF